MLKITTTHLKETFIKRNGVLKGSKKAVSQHSSRARTDTSTKRLSG
jgi:hypothetical protein